MLCVLDQEKKMSRKRTNASDLPAGINRRQRRRMIKSMRKARRIAYCSKKKTPEEAKESDNKETEKEPLEKVISTKAARNQRAKKSAKVKVEKRKFEQMAMIEKEEKEISAYAKKLGLNKRRNKRTVPKSFAEAGLDYVLEFCQRREEGLELDDDDGSLSQHSDDEDVDDEKDLLEQCVPVRGKSREAKPHKSLLDSPSRLEIDPESRPKKRVRFSGLSDDEEEQERSMADDDDDDDATTEEEPADEDDGQLHEDIYGRLRDKKGNVVSRDISLEKIEPVPAPSRAPDDLKDVDPKLLRTVKGILNRLSESNARQAASQIGQMMLTYSRNDVKVVLTKSIFDQCLAPDPVPQQLIMEYSLLIALIHSSVAVELSAYFIERLAKGFCKYWNDVAGRNTGPNMDKRLNNACQMFVFCYHLKVISASLIMQLVDDLVERFSETDIELLLLILQGCGFVLRKDKPLELKSLMGAVHRKISAPESAELKAGSRAKYMLDTLTAIKNNNDLKITNYDPSLSDHFRKLLRASVKSLEPALPMNLHDLYDADEKGRYWIVGSAVTTALIQEKQLEMNQGKPTPPVWKTEFSSDILELASKHRMNTDLRRTVFCIVMSAEDYLDAFEKLIKLELKGQQEREIVHVCLTCCINEEHFNPYYGWLIRQLCQYHRRFQLTTQFALWDKFKLLNGFKPWQRRNLASILSQLVSCKAISLIVLKVFEFGELKPSSIQMLRTFFKDFLTRHTASEIEDLFKCISTKDQNRVLYDGMSVFMQYYLTGKHGNSSPEEQELISERLAVIEKLRFS